MTKIFWAAILSAFACFSWSASYAASLPIREFNSIADLQASSDDPPLFSAYVGAYYCASPCTTLTPDGGEGLFVANGKCGQPDNGGSIIIDAKKYCWYRQNINGDLRQFGATLDSQYDCSGGRIDGCTSVDGFIFFAQTAAEGAGVHRLTTSGVQIRLASTSTFNLDDDMILDGGVGNPDVSNHTISTPGTIWTGNDTGSTPAIAIALGNRAVLENAAVMPYWLGKYMWDQSQTPGTHLSVPEQEYILSQMVAHGQEGAKCANPGCAIRNAAVAGYDTAIEVSAGQGATIESVRADGDVCMYLHGPTSGTHWRRIYCGVSATNDGPSERSFIVTRVEDDLSPQHDPRGTDARSRQTGKSRNTLQGAPGLPLKVGIWRADWRAHTRRRSGRLPV